MNNNNGMGCGAFLALLAGALIVLKLAAVISWGWLWVLAPLWMPVAAVAGVMLAVLMVVLVAGRDKK